MSSGPTEPTPPLAAALEVPTAGVPTYRVASPLRTTEAATEAVTVAAAVAGRGAEAAVAAAGVDGAVATGAVGVAAAEVNGSPSRAVISASLSAGNPLRLRYACSAAMLDLLHFFPAATNFATSSLMPALGALVAAADAGAAGAAAAATGTGVGTDPVEAGGGAASSLSHGMGRPAFNASISASVSSGRPSRCRPACSIAMNELLSCFLGQGGRCPRTPFPTLFGESSAIFNLPPGVGPQAYAQTQDFGVAPLRPRKYSPCCQLPAIDCTLLQRARLSAAFDIHVDDATVVQIMSAQRLHHHLCRRHNQFRSVAIAKDCTQEPGWSIAY